MEQFYLKMLEDYNRLDKIYTQARDNVNRHVISTQLLEDVSDALNDATILSRKLRNAHKKFQYEEFKRYSTKIIELKRKTNSLYSLLKNVKEELDNALKLHQVMLQLQKTNQKIEDNYVEYVNQMKSTLQKFKEETNDGVQTTVEDLKKGIEKSFQKIHSDLDKRLSESTEAIKKYYVKQFEDEKKNILQSFNEDYNTKLESFKKESLNPLEHRILTNVLTIFGVFVSFITIVMILVGTASSWLNASDISSAIIAFVVPSGIGVLIVCALTAFVRIITGDGSEAEKLSFRSQLKKWTPWLIVSVGCLLLAGSSIIYGYIMEKDRITQEAAKEPRHKIFVYNLADCICEEEGITKADGTKEIKQFVELSYFKDKSDEYVVERKEYDEYESFIHDGKLFYCVIHECFE